jgi:hypothetical protein
MPFPGIFYSDELLLPNTGRAFVNLSVAPKVASLCVTELSMDAIRPRVW